MAKKLKQEQKVIEIKISAMLVLRS